MKNAKLASYSMFKEEQPMRLTSIEGPRAKPKASNNVP